MNNEAKLKSFLSFGNVLSALFYSLIAVYLLVEHKEFWLNSFDRRIISGATIAGIDIGLRTSLYYQAVVLGICVFFVSIILLHFGFRFVSKRPSNLEYTYTLFHAISLFGNISIIFNLLGIQARINLLFLLSIQTFILFILFLGLVAWRYSWNQISQILAEKYFVIWIILQSFVVMFYAVYISKIFNLPTINLVVLYLIGLILSLLVGIAALSILIRNNLRNEKQAMGLMMVSSIPIFISPIYLPLANELYLILSQQGFLYLSPRKLLLLLWIITFIGVIMLFARKRKQTDYSFQSLLGRFYYPVFLVMLTAISFQPEKQIGPAYDLFESGNPGIAIDQLFRYGKIPILETFNAHAVSELYAPFLFSIINGYQGWGSFVYNMIFDKLIFILIGYFFLRKLLSNEMALLTLVFFPLNILTVYLLPEYYIVGIIAVFALHKVMKEPSFKSYLLFCFIIFFTFVWRFDIGASAIPAAIITLGLYWILYKKSWNIKNLFFSGVLIGGFWLFAFIVLALIKDVPILFRLKELMSVVSSNQIWGFTTLGNEEKLNYYLFYFIVPALAIGMTGFLIARTKIMHQLNPTLFTSLSFLLFFTIFNFPRGLVRHSLAENTPFFLLGFIAIPLACLPYLWRRTQQTLNNYVIFAVIGICYTFIVMSTMYGEQIEDQSLLSKSVNQFAEFNDYGPVDQKLSRYAEPEAYKNRIYGGLKALFDQTMEPNETFIDFSNAPMLYIYTKRETPMYINQTPTFLSDEVSQKSYLEEIKSYSIPYAVFADKLGFPGMDDVPNHIRSYRVAEYLYQNYVPFVKVNGFDVWVSKEKKAKIEQRLAELKQSTKEMDLYHPNDNRHGNLQFFDLDSITETKAGLLVETGNHDPQISGLFGRAGLENQPLVDNSKYELELKFTSKSGGNIQIYYLMNHSYSDEESITIPVKGSGVNEEKKVNIPYLGALKDIRLDLPNNDTFILRSLKLVEKTNTYQKLNKSYTESTNVGWVPYYWGEKDTLNAKNSVPVQLKIAQQETIMPGDKGSFPITKSFDNTKGNYIHLRVKSSVTGNDFPVVIEYGEGSDEISGAYQFNIKADGNYHDYLIRASSQYNWYLRNIRYVVIVPTEGIKIEEAAILQGD
jgi:hypothetical protein